MSDVFARFQEIWGSDYAPPVKMTPNELAVVERSLGFLFPQIYVDAIGRCGAFSARSELLDLIVDRHLDLRDVDEFFNPSEIRDTMLGWREAGMPEGLIPIAKDCMGNLFGFDEEDGQTARMPDSAVYFWDHDLNEVYHEAEGFDAWIGRYNSLSGGS